MSKELKDFIDENRRSFDDEMPGADTWNRIENSIAGKKSTKRFSIHDIYKWSAAAAVFFIATTCFYFLVLQKNKDKGGTSKEYISNITASDQDASGAAYTAAANKIHESIEKQQQELRSVTAGQPELYRQFSQDLATLDSSYRILKAQAVQTPNRELILEAMLQNLQLQAELLSKQLRIINEFKTDKKQQNEKKTYSNL